jgi:hypothetical protein
VADNDVILRIKVLADATAAAAGLDKAQQSTSKWQQGLKKAALPAAAAGAALIALGKKSLDAASDLQQSQGAIEAVFGKNAKAVEKNSNSAAKTMGLSASAYQNYAALVGTALQNAGFSVAQSVEESNKVMQRGADLSALYGGTTADAVEAINAAVSRSEFDPLEKYGVTLNMTAVNAILAAKGQDKLTGAALNTAKKQAILEEVYKQSSKAAGQYAREADSASGSQQTMAAEATNAAAALGTILLPAAAKVASALGEMAKWAQRNVQTVQILLGVIGGLAAAILIANAALKVAAVVQGIWNAAQLVGSKLALGTRIQLVALAVAEYAQAAATAVATAATWAYTAATTALGVAMKFLAANPVFLVVAAVIALGVALVIAYKKSAAFRAFVNAMWAGIRAGAMATLGALRAVWNAVLAAGRAVANAVRAAWQVVFAALTAYVRAYLAVFRAVFSGVRAAASAAASAVRGVWSGVSGAISALARLIRNSLVAAFQALRSVASTLGLRGPFDAVLGVINSVIRAVQSLIGWLGRIKVPNLGKLGGLIGKVTGRSVAAAPSGFAARAGVTAYGAAPSVAGLVGRTTVAGSGAAVVINISGAIDPESTARQIRRVLGSSDIRHGANRAGLRTV